MALDAVARETPAWLATSTMVGADDLAIPIVTLPLFLRFFNVTKPLSPKVVGKRLRLSRL
jgi:hypothetical protein